MLSAADIQEIRDEDPGAVLPGIDTMTGNPYATSSLLDVTKITQNTKAPYYYSPSTNSVFVTQSSIVLSGINFGDATVYLDANNVTVKTVISVVRSDKMARELSLRTIRSLECKTLPVFGEDSSAQIQI
jgi:hypothetical protein